MHLSDEFTVPSSSATKHSNSTAHRSEKMNNWLQFYGFGNDSSQTQLHRSPTKKCFPQHGVDHNILLGRMFNMFGMRNSTLDWFKSYLSKRSFTVLVHDVESEHKFPACGIPQLGEVKKSFLLNFEIQ